MFCFVLFCLFVFCFVLRKDERDILSSYFSYRDPNNLSVFVNS